MASGYYTKFGFVIEGAKELDAKLKTLPASVEKKVIRKGVREAQKPLQVAAKSSARSLLANSRYPDAVDMSKLTWPATCPKSRRG